MAPIKQLYSFVAGSALTLQAALASPIAGGNGNIKTLEAGHLGAVASESDICSHIGVDLLKKGGNAADAMVGTVACVGVVGMYHSGTFWRRENTRNRNGFGE